MTKLITLSSLLALAFSSALAAPDVPKPAVIGKLEVVKNGEPQRLGSSLLANQAKFTLINTATQQRHRVRVGRDGHFSWRLAPGQYQLSGIDFLVRGERVTAQSHFVLTVTDALPATYVGTLSLETRFASGFYGLSGTVDRLAVADDCRADCAPMLAQLGLDEEAVAVMLMRPNLELVSLESTAARR